MASHGKVNLIEKYARPAPQRYEAPGTWADATVSYETIQKDLAKAEKVADYGIDPLWFTMRGRVSIDASDPEPRARWLDRLETALLADGWNAVTFESEAQYRSTAWVTLYALKEPLVVETIDGEVFPATFQPDGAGLEHPTTAAERIVRDGCWRYTQEYREHIPPHRIAAVRHFRRP